VIVLVETPLGEIEKVVKRPGAVEVLPLIGEEEINAVIEVLKSRKLSQLVGNKVKEFEEAFAKYHNVKHAIAVCNGTAALHVALASIGVGPGDEVITVPFTFVSSATAILHQNGVPIFADIDPRTFNIDPESVKERITKRTKAIIPVHLLGQPAEMDDIMKIAEEHDLKVVEDCAQAAGAEYKGKKVGSIGDVGCFSFYQTKNVTTGEGGMVITNDDEIAKRAKMLRMHGEIGWYRYEFLGWNYRMTEINAAIGIEQLKKLDKFNEKRIENAKYYTEHLKNVKYLILPYAAPYVKHVFHVYNIRLANGLQKYRDEFFGKLKNAGVPIWLVYPGAFYTDPLFQEFKAYGSGCPFECPLYRRKRGKVQYQEGLCPNAEEVGKDVISLFTDPALTEDELDFTVDTINKTIQQYVEEGKIG
jgi:dTDP-4-amino-4,6-dideoxygalactose transaminase